MLYVSGAHKRSLPSPPHANTTSMLMNFQLVLCLLIYFLAYFIQVLNLIYTLAFILVNTYSTVIVLHFVHIALTFPLDFYSGVSSR